MAEAAPAKKMAHEYDTSIFSVACMRFISEDCSLMRTSSNTSCVTANMRSLYFKKTRFSGSRVFFVCKHRRVCPGCEAAAVLVREETIEEQDGAHAPSTRHHVMVPSALRLVNGIRHSHIDDRSAQGLPVDVHSALVREIKANSPLGPKQLFDKVIYCPPFSLFLTKTAQLSHEFAGYGVTYVDRITQNRVEDARKQYLKQHAGEGSTNSRQKSYDFVSTHVRVAFFTSFVNPVVHTSRRLNISCMSPNLQLGGR